MPITLVVGASGELGAAVARALAAAGHEVILHGHTNEAALSDLAITIGGSTVLADVTNEEQVESLFASLPALDHLVYCAGVNPIAATVADTNISDWRRIVDVNLTGAFLCTRCSLKVMRGSTDPAVVLVSSIFGLETPARRAAYGASKHGLNGLVQALTKEEGHWLRVNAVCPGPMWSENLRRIVEKHASAEGIPVEEYILSRVADVPAARLMELDECAAVVAFLCSSAASFIRGESIRISGGAVQ